MIQRSNYLIGTSSKPGISTCSYLDSGFQTEHISQGGNAKAALHRQSQKHRRLQCTIGQSKEASQSQNMQDRSSRKPNRGKQSFFFLSHTIIDIK